MQASWYKLLAIEVLLLSSYFSAALNIGASPSGKALVSGTSTGGSNPSAPAKEAGPSLLGSGSLF